MRGFIWTQPMTVLSSTSRSGPYLGAGLTGPYVIGFKFLSDSHLEVIKTEVATGIETTLTLTTDYTATGAGSDSGGTLTLTAALSSSYTLTIQLNVPITQELDYVESDGFPAESHEAGLDKLTQIAQILKRILDRTIRAPESAAVFAELPAAATRANRTLGFDATGNPTVLTPTDGSAAAVLSDLANTASTALGDALVGVKRGATGAVAMTGHAWHEAQVLNAKEFGAVGDDSTDNTTALQAWINACIAGGAAGYLPSGVYRHGALTLTNTTVRGCKFLGDGSGDYGTIGASPTRGSVLKYTGSATGITVDGNSSPKAIAFEGITFVGSSSALIGMSLRRATNVFWRDCVWYGFNNGSGKALVLNTTAAEFVGVLEFDRCVWLKNTIGIHALKSSVNLVQFFGGQFGSNTQDVVAGEAGVAMDTRNWAFHGTSFEETTSNCVYSYGGAQNWAFFGCYVEQNDAANNNPRFHFAANGSSPISSGVVFVGNTFSKQHQSSTQRLIALESVNGATIRGNWSGYPIAAEGVFTNRYFVDADASCSNLDVELTGVVSGATPYPIRVNSVVYASDYNGRSVDLRGTVSRGGYDLGYGYRPQNNQSGAYSFLLPDAVQDVITGSSAITWTVQPDATTNFPIGTKLRGINDSTGAITVARGAGVAIILSSSGVDANRSVASRGLITLTKVGANRWFAEGPGVT